MRRFLILFLSTGALLVPFLAAAADSGFVSLANYQGSPQLDGIYKSNSLPKFFNALFQFSLSIGAILAVVMIVWGGYLYMFKDSFASKLNAKEKITNAVIGLLLLLGIYLILYQINPDILKWESTFPKSSSTSAPRQAQSSMFTAPQPSVSEYDCLRDPACAAATSPYYTN